jgi:hypothetical protein
VTVTRLGATATCDAAGAWLAGDADGDAVALQAPVTRANATINPRPRGILAPSILRVPFMIRLSSNASLQSGCVVRRRS